MSFGGSCEKCGGRDAFWYHVKRSEYFCVKCAKECNTTEEYVDKLPVCQPARVGLAYRPSCDENRFDDKTHVRLVERMSCMSSTDWLVYYKTPHADDQVDTGTCFHTWAEKQRIRVRNRG